jgi:hypothetical protein
MATVAVCSNESGIDKSRIFIVPSLGFSPARKPDIAYAAGVDGQRGQNSGADVAWVRHGVRVSIIATFMTS